MKQEFKENYIATLGEDKFNEVHTERLNWAQGIIDQPTDIDERNEFFDRMEPFSILHNLTFIINSITFVEDDGSNEEFMSIYGTFYDIDNFYYNQKFVELSDQDKFTVSICQIINSLDMELIIDRELNARVGDILVKNYLTKLPYSPDEQTDILLDRALLDYFGDSIKLFELSDKAITEIRKRITEKNKDEINLLYYHSREIYYDNISWKKVSARLNYTNTHHELKTRLNNMLTSKRDALYEDILSHKDTSKGFDDYYNKTRQKRLHMYYANCVIKQLIPKIEFKLTDKTNELLNHGVYCIDHKFYYTEELETLNDKEFLETVMCELLNSIQYLAHEKDIEETFDWTLEKLQKMNMIPNINSQEDLEGIKVFKPTELQHNARYVEKHYMAPYGFY